METGHKGALTPEQLAQLQKHKTAPPTQQQVQQPNEQIAKQTGLSHQAIQKMLAPATTQGLLNLPQE